MSIFTKFRAYVALGLYVFSVAVLGAPHLYALIAWNVVTRADASTRRRRAAHWQMFWGCTLARVAFWIMGITAAVSRRPYADVRSSIIVSNHPSGPLDGFLLMLMFRRIGLDDFRSIMKREVLRMPVIGRSCKEAGCAFLTRGKDKSADLAEIARCAHDAWTDDASVLIFPEGTRFRGSKPGSSFTRVLPPKSAGLATLLAELPEYPVLSVTIAWDRAITNGVDTVSSIASYVGARVSIEAVMIKNVHPASAEAWLESEWRRKDAALTAQA